jgi:hypothetical protein
VCFLFGNNLISNVTYLKSTLPKFILIPIPKQHSIIAPYPWHVPLALDRQHSIILWGSTLDCLRGMHLSSYACGLQDICIKCWVWIVISVEWHLRRGCETRLRCDAGRKTDAGMHVSIARNPKGYVLAVTVVSAHECRRGVVRFRSNSIRLCTRHFWCHVQIFEFVLCLKSNFRELAVTTGTKRKNHLLSDCARTKVASLSWCRSLLP